ncbi:MAG TPA: LysR family transcriptional regulator [Gemmatimonadales bacterium]|nr:LysR family transcriptional regulator [Gemmatimonadales bacterium]
MDFSDLRYFGAIAATQSFTRAAREARIAQPALSRRIRVLERELDIVLLNRGARGVTLTAAGETFAAAATQLLSDAAAALERAQATAAGRRGRVILAAMRAAVAGGFPIALQESLRQDHPEIALVVQDFDPPDTWEAVADGRADVAVCVESALMPGLVAELLWIETIDRAIVPRSHPLATRGTVSLSDFGSLPLLVSPNTVSPETAGRIAEPLQQAGLRSPVELIAGDLRAVHLAVAQGRGWTLVMRSRAEARPEGTAVLTVTGLAMKVRMQAIWRRGERRPVVGTVLQRVLQLGRANAGNAKATVAPLPPPLPHAPRARRPRFPPGTIPPGLELAHLRALVAVAASQTIGRSAKQLGITQPALSRRLAALENVIGIALLERSARGVTLTPAGHSLADDAPALLSAADRFLHEISRARRGVEGRCVIGAVATAASSALLARVTERCLTRHPEIHVLVEEVATPKLPAALASAEIDLGLGHAFPIGRRPAGIVVTPVQKDMLDTALIPPTHALALRRRIEARELRDLPFLFMERVFQPEFYDRVLSSLKAHGLVPRIEASYDSLHIVWALVAQGKGWALGFHSQRARPPSGTAAVHINDFRLPFGLDLLSRVGESRPPVLAVAAAFREISGSRRKRRSA